MVKLDVGVDEYKVGGMLWSSQSSSYYAKTGYSKLNHLYTVLGKLSVFRSFDKANIDRTWVAAFGLCDQKKVRYSYE